MDALRRAENSANEHDTDDAASAHETSAPVEEEQASLALEPIKGTAPQNHVPTENRSEGSTPAEPAANTSSETAAAAKPDADNHGRVLLAPRSTRTQNILMFGSGFILILLAVGGYYAWKSSQLPTPGHFQSATLISAPPVNTKPTNVRKVMPAKAATIPVQTVKKSGPGLTKLVTPVKSIPTGQAEHRTASTIRISKKRSTPRVSPTLSDAWRDYRQQNYTGAERKYKQVLHQYPDNRDAMLGLAAIAMYRNRNAVARYYYERVLKKHPGDNVARVALLSLIGSGDTLKDGSRLKHWLQSDPNNPQLHFSLGNYFAGNGHWKEAQHAYFEAFRLAPTRADYAFNLAVTLDQLALQKQALNYYRKARELAGTSALFSIEQLDQRISRLQQNGAPGS